MIQRRGKQWQVAELGLLNKRTGELFDAEIRIAKRKGGHFMKVWEDAGWDARILALKGETARLLWWLTRHSGWANAVPGPSKVAGAMGIKQPHISRAYGELIKASFLLRREGGFYLNPLFCWKGGDEQYEQAVAELGKVRDVIPTSEVRYAIQR